MQVLKRLSLCFLLAFAGFCINFFTYSPGFMSGDTVDQLHQAITGVYTTWHPPAMALWWHILGSVSGAYAQPMLAFQLILLWGSYYMFASISNGKTWAISLFIAFLVMPVIHNFAGYIIKDVQMSLSWMFAVSILLKYAIARGKIPFIWIVVAAVLLAYGAWVRHNALPGLLTLCLLWSWVVFVQHKRITRTIIAAGLFITIIISGNIINYLARPKANHPEVILYMHDLSAMYVTTGEQVFPESAYRDPDFDTAYIRKNFHPAIYDHIAWNKDNKAIVKRDDKRASDLKAAWLNAIKSYPMRYISNRWETFLYFLHIKHYSEIIYFHPYISDNPLGYKTNPDKLLYDIYFDAMCRQRHAFYFNAWFWLSVNIVLFYGIIFIHNKRHKFLYSCILISGLAYFLPYFFLITNDSDFRYVYWTCISCVAAVIFLIASRRSGTTPLKQPESIR